MKKGDKILLSNLEDKVDFIRRMIIAELQTLIGKDELNLYDNEIFVNHSNTETLMTYVTKKGYATDEGPAFVLWSETSTDVLLLLLKILYKNIQKLRA